MARKQSLYNGIPTESDEEVHFLMWCKELQTQGYIEEVTRAEAFQLSPPLIHEYEVDGKKGKKRYKQTLLRGHEYTPEFKVKWNTNAVDRLVYSYVRPVDLLPQHYTMSMSSSVTLGSFMRQETPIAGIDSLFIGHKMHNGIMNRINGISDLVTFIEVKPQFDRNNMTRAFKINQKWVWDKHNIYINLVICPDLFQKTFTPEEYLKTKTGKDRKINWDVRSVDDYLNM